MLHRRLFLRFKMPIMNNSRSPDFFLNRLVSPTVQRKHAAAGRTADHLAPNTGSREKRPFAWSLLNGANWSEAALISDGHATE
jgi:hypothetical protein